jgi:hypothetical protein
LECPDSYAIYALRQACDYLYKLSLDFDEADLSLAENNFVSTDNNVYSIDTHDKRVYVNSLRAFFETHYRFHTNSLDGAFHCFTPRPGPGTFSGKSLYELSSHVPWYVRKDRDWSIDTRFGAWAWASRPASYTPLSTCQDLNYSEVLFVPKDSRGPRTIVREPFSLLKAQMTFNAWLSSELEDITKKRVNFKDQQVNRELARIGSLDNSWATMDLKDASDSVSFHLCVELFRNNPIISGFLRRSTRLTKLPSGKFLTLKKVAGMGSGITFPLMSLVIHLAITHAISKRYGLTFPKASALVYVYGDDIIVPTRYVTTAYKALERVGLRVNSSKSFSTGPFRESCGGDFFKGQDVCPLRLKLSGPRIELRNRKATLRVFGGHGLLAIERHCRLLVKSGLSSTSEYFYSQLENVIGELPFGDGETAALVRYTPGLSHDHYSRDETGTYKSIRACVPVPVVSKYDAHPTIALSRALGKVHGPHMSHFPSDKSLFFTEVFKGKKDFSTADPLEIYIPRKVSLRRSKVSTLSLLG